MGLSEGEKIDIATELDTIQQTLSLVCQTAPRDLKGAGETKEVLRIACERNKQAVEDIDKMIGNIRKILFNSTNND